MPPFTAKAWRKVRPESAKDTAVASAIGEVDKACAKAVVTMSAAENKAAKKAPDDLATAWNKGKKAADEDAKGKDRSAALDLIDKWQKEIKTLIADLALDAGYNIRVAAVQAEYDQQYRRIRGDVDRCHAAAIVHNRNTTRPSDIDLQRYMVAVRDGAGICSKQSIPSHRGYAATL